MNENEEPIEVVQRETVFAGKWIGVDKVDFRVKSQPSKPNGMWECAYRKNRPKESMVDGVSIIAKLRKKGFDDQILLIKQFRVPLMNWCIEFPAGLVDAGETPREAAVRELKEETGYTLHNIHYITKNASLPLDPGMCSSNIQLVVGEIDGDLPSNQNPTQTLDDSELIEVIPVKVSELTSYLEKCAENRIAIEASVQTFALGIVFGGF